MTSELDHQGAGVVEVGGGSYELFYMRQRKRLMSLAYVVTGSRAGAEDLAQEALAQIFHEALWVPGVVGDLGEVGVVGLVWLWRGTRMCDPVFGHAV